MTELRANAITIARGGRTILRDVSLALGPGEMVALLGPNGSGKTTLLRTLLGLAPPARGDVTLDGKSLAAIRRAAVARSIAYVPQQHRAVFPFSVREIVAMGRAPVTGWGAVRSDDGAVTHALERAGIARLAGRPYTALSGGEQQSVLIARALAQGAPILLLDEPAAALDPGQRHRLLATLRALCADGMTVLASLHDPEAAIRAFDRAIMLRHGEVMADGPCGATLTPALLATAYDLPDDASRDPPMPESAPARRDRPI